MGDNMKNNGITKIKEEKINKCFTFGVTMVVQIIAETEAEAESKLDKEGGIVTRREVTLFDTLSLYNGLEKK